jgi:aspartate 1-decarboxylase
MQRVIMKSENHRATMTRALVDFEGTCVSAHMSNRALRDCTSAALPVDANTVVVEQAAIA